MDNDIEMIFETFEDAISLKRMDGEMNKLSSDLMRLYTQSSTLHAEVAPAIELLNRQSASKGQDNWDSLVSSPLVEGEGENKTLKLQFDVSQFDPAEVKVNIQNEMLVVSAAHEENTDTSSMVRKFHREFMFPKGVDPCTVHSTLSNDGVLIVEAPLP